MKDFELKKGFPLAGVYKNLTRNRLEIELERAKLSSIEARKLANWLWDAAKEIEEDRGTNEVSIQA